MNADGKVLHGRKFVRTLQTIKKVTSMPGSSIKAPETFLVLDVVCRRACLINEVKATIKQYIRTDGRFGKYRATLRGFNVVGYPVQNIDLPLERPDRKTEKEMKDAIFAVLRTLNMAWPSSGTPEYNSLMDLIRVNRDAGYNVKSLNALEHLPDNNCDKVYVSDLFGEYTKEASCLSNNVAEVFGLKGN